jgi:hypothetical protein
VLPESAVALVFSLRLTQYPLSLWIGEYFRGSLTLMLAPLEDMLAESQQPTHQHERLKIAHRNALRLAEIG